MDLSFTRGDTQFIRFQLKSIDGNPIDLADMAVLYFTVKQNSNSKKRLFQKKYPNEIQYSGGYYYFVIESEDTSSMPYGTYVYDIEMKSGKYVKTLGSGTLTLMDETTFRSDEL